MYNFKRILINKYLQCFQIYEIYRLDWYRKKYDSLSFGSKIKKANRWLKLYPEQVHFNLSPIIYWLKNIVPKPVSVLEIGGWRGDLAEKALSSFEHIELWHNYDLLKNNNYQKCHDSRYKLISLEEDIWYMSLNFEYNALIATHMIEHINWKEFTELINWIPASIRTVLFEAPLPASNEKINWTGDFSSHVLEKGWEQVVTEMKNHGFSVDYSEGNTFIFKR
jgi:hypothetical protein